MKIEIIIAIAIAFIIAPLILAAINLDHCGATYSIEGETGFHQI